MDETWSGLVRRTDSGIFFRTRVTPLGFSCSFFIRFALLHPTWLGKTKILKQKCENYANLSLSSRTHHYLVVDLNHFIASQYFQVDIGGGLRREVGHNNKLVKFSTLVLFLPSFLQITITEQPLYYSTAGSFTGTVMVMVAIRTSFEKLKNVNSWIIELLILMIGGQSWVAHPLQETAIYV